MPTCCAGWSACPFHAAALKCLRSMAAWGIQLEVKEFPDMHARLGLRMLCGPFTAEVPTVACRRGL